MGPHPIVTASSFDLPDMLVMTGDYLTMFPACMLRMFNAKRPTIKALPVDLGIETRPVTIFA